MTPHTRLIRRVYPLDRDHGSRFREMNEELRRDLSIEALPGKADRKRERADEYRWGQV